MRAFLIAVALVGCSNDNHSTIDAMKPIDAAIPIDAAPDASPPTCSSYCSEIQANCTGDNAQYANSAACTAACASFSVGTSTDMSGNTLGCRIYHAGTPSVTAPATDCPHAGPAGDLIAPTPPSPEFCSGGDICASFCALEVQACGSQISRFR